MYAIILGLNNITQQGNILIILISYILLGSWFNFVKTRQSNWPVQFFYWDFMAGIIFTTLLVCIIFSVTGSFYNYFIIDVFNATNKALSSAFFGGVVFNFGTILLVISISITRIYIAICSSMAFALLIALLVENVNNILYSPYTFILSLLVIISSIFFLFLMLNNSSILNHKQGFNGIITALLSGLIFAFFFKFINPVMDNSLYAHSNHLLAPISYLVMFVLGIISSNFLWNSNMIVSQYFNSRFIFLDYFKIYSVKYHIHGFLGGVACCSGIVGLLLTYRNVPSYLTDILGITITTIGIISGILWKEFKMESALVKKYTLLFYSLLVLGIMVMNVITKF